MLHSLLERQLKRLGVADASVAPSYDLWHAFLERVSRTYREADQDRYTIERSLTISSREMQDLYEALAAEKAALERATELAVRDPLTGLANHRGAHLRLDELMHGELGRRRSLSLVLADLDGLKLFNDTYGHASGDDILRLVAQILQQHCPPPDVACRYGGDEFLLILPGRGRRSALALTRRLSSALGHTEFRSPAGEHVPLSLAMGIASMPADAVTIEKLIAAADSAMYAAKRREARPRPNSSAISESGTANNVFGVLDSLVQAIDAKDHYTRRHSDVVAEYAMKLAARLKLSDESQRALRMAGLLHDVGKLVIPDDVLKKPGSLTTEEYNLVKQHVVIGEVLIRELPQLKDIIQAVSCHHERYDGNGYPRGLRGRRIPLLGRIIAIADAYSAMVLDRPYRKALPLRQAIAELEAGAGSQFDPEMVAVFVDLVAEEAKLIRLAA